MVEFAILFSTGKVIFKAFFSSVFDVLHFPLNQTFLQRGMGVVF